LAYDFKVFMTFSGRNRTGFITMQMRPVASESNEVSHKRAGC
jgi:hypothetical protein